MEIREAQSIVGDFIEARAWNLITLSQRGNHIGREVGKLFEYILYMEGVTTKSPEMEKLPKQLGDILFSLMALANMLEVDLGEQLRVSMDRDDSKYPAEETRQLAVSAFREKALPMFRKTEATAEEKA